MLSKSFTIAIPSEEGFVDRKCSSCHKSFKLFTASLKDKLYCPYCGCHQDLSSMWTEEQEEYVSEFAKEKITEEVSRELSATIRKAFRGNNFFTFKEKPYKRKFISTPKGITTDCEIECFSCGGKFQVKGIIGYCPLCRYENRKIYDVNIEIIKKEIIESSCSERSLRHAYEDLISSFEGICKKKFPDAVEVNFQSLRNTKHFMKKTFNTDIYKNISESEKREIKKVFEKRHVHNHPFGDKGIISEKYIKEVPEDKKLLGQKAELSFEEFERGAEVLGKILSNMDSK